MMLCSEAPASWSPFLPWSPSILLRCHKCILVIAILLIDGMSFLMAPLALLWMMFSFVSPFAFAAILLGYLLPHAVVSLFFTSRDLKKAYDAEWALVTGASSGEIKRTVSNCNWTISNFTC